MKVKVLLAHSQKPPTETRIFEKLAAGLVGVKNIEIKIVGSKSWIEFPNTNPIKMEGIFTSDRRLIFRIINIFRYWKALNTFSPDVLIVCSIDLLIPGILYAIKNKVKIIYDFQENTVMNVKFQQIYLEGGFTRISQILYLILPQVFRYVDSFWFAEKIYHEQMNMPLDKFIILENKVPEFWIQLLKSQNSIIKSWEDTRFLFSGVITEESGILKGIEFFTAFQKCFAQSTFTILGVIPNYKLKKKLQDAATENQKIQIVNEGKWASSEVILKGYLNCDAVFFSYNETLANKGKLPTKLFESMFLGKPVLYQEKGHFSAQIEDHKAGIPVDYENIESNDFHKIKKLVKEFHSVTSEKNAFVFDTNIMIADFNRLISPSGF